MNRYKISGILVIIALVATSNAVVWSQSLEGKQSLNGTQLFVATHGKGEPLLVIHGGPGLNHHYFRPHLSALESEFKVVYFDQRASGMSSTPSSDSITLAFMVEDIEALRKKLEITRWHVLAHSWGVVLAARYALEYPDRVQKMVFSNPGLLSREFDAEAAAIVKARSTPADSIKRASILSKGNLSVADIEELFRMSFRMSAYDPSAIDRLDLHLPANFSTASRALFTGLSNDATFNANLYDSLPGFKFPVMIVHGEADITPPSSLKKLQEAIPNATLKRFKESGHFPFVEETEAYSREVTKFLRGGG
jgi:proline iminopeptidase